MHASYDDHAMFQEETAGLNENDKARVIAELIQMGAAGRELLRYLRQKDNNHD